MGKEHGDGVGKEHDGSMGMRATQVKGLHGAVLIRNMSKDFEEGMGKKHEGSMNNEHETRTASHAQGPSWRLLARGQAATAKSWRFLSLSLYSFSPFAFFSVAWDCSHYSSSSSYQFLSVFIFLTVLAILRLLRDAATTLHIHCYCFRAHS